MVVCSWSAKQRRSSAAGFKIKDGWDTSDTVDSVDAIGGSDELIDGQTARESALSDSRTDTGERANEQSGCLCVL